MALVCDVLDRRDDDTHVGTLCWELGGRCSDQTIARLHVDTGVAWFGVVFSYLSCGHYGHLYSSSPVCHLRGTVYFHSPHC